MGRAMRYVPKGKGEAAPDPPNVWDAAVLTGPNRVEIMDLLEESTEIAEVDWAWRHLLKRRTEIWIQLAQLGVTNGRMQRAYAIDGKPITSHVTILKVLQRAGVEVPKQQRPHREESEI